MPRSTIRIPRADGTTDTISGTPVLLPLVEGEPPVRFLIEVREANGIGNLVHYASGQIFYSRLNDAGTLHFIRTGSRLTPRGMARAAVNAVVARMGGDTARIHAVIAAAPVLNPEPRRRTTSQGQAGDQEAKDLTPSP